MLLQHSTTLEKKLAELFAGERRRGGMSTGSLRPQIHGRMKVNPEDPDGVRRDAFELSSGGLLFPYSTE